MSKENRKRLYDKLLESGELHKLSAPLKAEFGDPLAKKEVPKPAPKAAPAKKAEPKPKDGGKK